MIRFVPLALVLVASSVSAEDRTFSVGSFERVRVDGPFRVQIATGASPGAHARGDRQLLERLVVEVNGTTLTVRVGTGGWGETPATRVTEPPLLMLTTPRLTALAVTAGAEVMVARMASQRLDLSVTGAGAVTVARAEADELNAALLGTGTITLSGRTNRARLVTNGPGMIDAAGLETKDLIVRQDGAGETRANARYTAQVTTTGLGRVTVAGNAKCTVKAIAGGPVNCGPKL